MAANNVFVQTITIMATRLMKLVNTRDKSIFHRWNHIIAHNDNTAGDLILESCSEEKKINLDMQIAGHVPITNDAWVIGHKT